MYRLILVSLVSLCFLGCGSEPPPTAPEPTAPVAAPEPLAEEVAKADFTDRVTVQMPVNEDFMNGKLTGGYTIKNEGTTYTFSKNASIRPEVYATAPDVGHVLAEYIADEGPTVVVDYELKWNVDKTRFDIATRSVQAVDGAELYSYEADGDLFRRSE